MRLLFKLCLVWFTSVNIQLALTDKLSQDDYFGPYDICFDFVKSCQAPKSGDRAAIMFTPLNEKHIYVVNTSVSDVVHLQLIKIVIYYTESSVRNPIWAYNVKKPCEHFILKPLLMASVNASADCVVQKGNHIFNLDVEKAIHDIIGSSFFYGDLQIKTVLLAKEGNFICFISHALLKKKTT